MAKNNSIPYEEETLEMISKNHKKAKERDKDKGKVIKFPWEKRKEK